MGYSAKQRKVKTTVEGASALVKELKAMEDAAASVMMAGAKAVQVGTAIFTDPYAPVRIIEGLESYMEENNLNSLEEIVGTVQPW